MNNNDFRTYLATNNLDLDELSTDAENVLRRCFESAEMVPEMYRDITGLLQIRWAA